MRKYFLLPILAIALLAVSQVAAQAACTVPYSFSSGTTASSSQVNGNFSAVAACTANPIPTRQVLTSGTSATYTTPANARELRIRMVGAGGPGYGTSVGTNGGATTFNGITANGGGRSGGADGAAGGTGGAGAASYRISGAGSQATPVSGASFGGAGASSVFGGGSLSLSVSPGGYSAPANSGSGGSGTPPYSGGGAGEYVEIIINSPAATYTYTVGAGGVATGTAGNGGSGVIIVDEYY